MAIYRLLKNRAFGPDEIKVLTAAYEEALRTLRLANRSDPKTEIVAKKIIELAQRGERDPVRLRECAIRSLTSASPPALRVRATTSVLLRLCWRPRA
jgi:hypothetical protein